MVSIHNAGENDFVSKLVGGIRVWTGGKRACDGCKGFVWSDGSSWNYQSWSPGQPDDHVRMILLE